MTCVNTGFLDGVPGGLNRIAESLGIARGKLVPLW
jgi:hypothetical protein